MEFIFIFIGGMIIGGLVELVYSIFHEYYIGKPFRLNHRFTIAKRVSVISLPFWGLVFLIAFNHYQFALLFIFTSIVGPVMEFLTGEFIYRVFGVKLWTYKHGAIGEFTSIYSIPYWGIAGILSVTLAKIINIWGF